MTVSALSTLQRLLITHFDLSELQALCFDLGVDHENLPATSKDELARQLILYQARRERVDVLLEECRRRRPMVDWPALPAGEIAALLAPVGGRAAVNDRKRGQQLVLMDKVRRFWIDGVLRHSLAAEEPLELRWTPAPEALDQPWQGIVAPYVPADDEPQSTLLELFLDSGRALLILGQPGSGKTISMLRLAESLIALAELDENQAIPVVLNLASWAADRAEIAKWAGDELAAKYQIPRQLSGEWLANDELILLLDGLDEVPDSRRDDCVEALNRFRGENGLTGLVVCSRYQAYLASERKLQLGQAIRLAPLSEAQIQGYLAATDRSLKELRQALALDDEIASLAESPLLLNVMINTYEDSDLPSSLLSSAAMSQRQQQMDSLNQQLFFDFCNRAYERRGLDRVAVAKIERRLSWLARRMDENNQSVFLVELIQPNWLGPRLWQWLYLLISRLAMGLVIGLSMALYSFNPVMVPVNLFLGMVLGLSHGLLYERRRGSRQLSRGRRALESIMLGLAAAVLATSILYWLASLSWEAAALWGAVTGTFYAIADFFIFGYRFEDDIRIVEGLSWSWANALRALPAGLALGVLLGWLAGQALQFGFQQVAGVAVETGTVVLLFGGLRYRRLARDSYPNQGIRRALTNGLKAGVLFGLVIGLVVGLVNLNIIHRPFAWRPMWAVFAFLIYGGFFVFEHFLIRLILILRGKIEFRFVRFLDLAASLAFLHKVGGGYIFMHRLLREHFVRLAGMP